MTPIKAIRAKCLDCCCDNAKEVRLCASADCPLYEYRFGHRPKKGGAGGTESPTARKTPSYGGFFEVNEQGECNNIPKDKNGKEGGCSG